MTLGITMLSIVTLRIRTLRIKGLYETLSLNGTKHKYPVLFS